MEFPHLVVARLYEHIGPIDRGDRYEDPLDAVLQKAGVGRVTGGGSQLGPLGVIEHADVEVELADPEEGMRVVAEALEAAGAPEGSEIIDGSSGRVLRTFGSQQCLAIYLDGASLPDEVYAELDFDAVLAEINSAAGDDTFRGVWQGPEETGLFYFGPDADAIFACVEPLLRRLPIGQNARVVIRSGRSKAGPREVRLPRH
jgi:hypothetical protein